jgi:flavodoxin
MKKLIVYYSLEGNTRFIARLIAETVGADLLELKPKEDISPTGFSRFLKGGGQVIKNVQPELLPFDKRPEDYDMIVIGTPVWAWSYAPALATFFSTISLKGKRIALFCCSGGGKGRTLAKMKEKLAGNEFIGEIDFVDPARRSRELNTQKAKAWAQKVLQ